MSNLLMNDPQFFLTVLAWTFLVVLAILWIALPFAVFGTKDKLTELIKETKRTNQAIEKLRQELSGRSSSDNAD